MKRRWGALVKNRMKKMEFRKLQGFEALEYRVMLARRVLVADAVIEPPAVVEETPEITAPEVVVDPVAKPDDLVPEVAEPEVIEPEFTPPNIGITIIGDSVSAGMTLLDASGDEALSRQSYRPLIWEYIASTFPDEGIGFVGPSDYNSEGLPPEAQRHAAYRGYGALNYHVNEHARSTDPHGPVSTAPQISARGWATFDSDIALVLIGVNDLNSNRFISGPDSIEQSIQEIIIALRAENSDVEILLGTMPESRGRDVMPLNEMIVGIPEPTETWPGSTAASTIHIVDHYSGTEGVAQYDASIHTTDGLHPNGLGDEILAANWWATLEGVLTAKVQEKREEPVRGAATPPSDAGVVELEVAGPTVVSPDADPEAETWWPREDVPAESPVARPQPVVDEATSEVGDPVPVAPEVVDPEVSSEQPSVEEEPTEEPATEQDPEAVESIEDHEIVVPEVEAVDPAAPLTEQDETENGENVTGETIDPGPVDDPETVGQDPITPTPAVDPEPVLPVISISTDASLLVEGDVGQVRITRTGDLSTRLTVPLDSTGSAMRYGDYWHTRSVVIPADVDEVVVTMMTFLDMFDAEPDEEVTLSVVADSDRFAVSEDSSLTFTIRDAALAAIAVQEEQEQSGLTE